MPIPNADRAIIAIDKLTAYLLNASHRRGGAKARLLLGLGYQVSVPERLAHDLRKQHLSLEAMRTSSNDYGVSYRIEGGIVTPCGRSVRFCSIWQVGTGTDRPRFITMYPR